jgi:hypothetical protein
MASEIANVDYPLRTADLCFLAGLNDAIRTLQGPAENDGQRLELQITDMRGIRTRQCDLDRR